MSNSGMILHGRGVSKIQAIEAEECIIASILMDNSVLHDCTLEPSDFFNSFYRECFNVLSKGFAAGKTMDLVMLSSEVGEHLKLSQITDQVFTVGQFDKYVGLVKNASILRHLKEVTLDINIMIEQGKTPDEILEKVEEDVTSINQDKQRQGFKRIRDSVDDHLHEVKHIHTTKQPLGIASGFNAIDKRTGGLAPGKFYVIAARPAVGKTTLALNIGLNVAEEGNPVGILSLEMMEKELLTRMICSRAMVDSLNIINGRCTDDEIKKYRLAARKIQTLPLYIRDDGRTTLTQLKASARGLVHKNKIKLLIVDYIQLMKTGDSRQSRYDQVTEISRELKSTAKSLSIPIIAVASLSRESEKANNRRPKMSDIRMSGDIEYDADVIIFQHIEKNQDETQELIFAKNRGGPVGFSNLDFYKQFNLLQEPRTDSEEE